MSTTTITPYGKTTVYILDACEDRAMNRERDIISAHYQKQRNMRRMFERYFDGDITEVNKVIFEPRTRSDAVSEYFEQQLRSKGPDDFVLIYFHGGAGNNGPDYCWKFTHGYPRREIDAYQLIQTIRDSDVDCLLLLDCYIPDRFFEKWTRGEGNLEIIATGQPLQHSDGTYVEGDPGDFTKALIRGFDECMEKAMKLKPAEERITPQDHRAPRTIPHLLSTNKSMSFNPRRLHLGMKREDWDASLGVPFKVKCFVLLPENVKDTGKIQFFLRTKTTGVADEGEAVQEQPNEEQEDEGLGPELAVEGPNGEDGQLFV